MESCCDEMPVQHKEAPTEKASHKVIPLDQGWKFRQHCTYGGDDETSVAETETDKDDLSQWRPVSQFPTNIHLDLLHHKLIPDPFIGKNELEVQWVGEATWVYQTVFSCPALEPGQKAVLEFQGLDTFASIMINDAVILETDNMFLPTRKDITHVVRESGLREFTLSITFDSAHHRGLERIRQYPKHKWGCWNGEISRLAVRKAQYHWGWDWGPKLITCGPWRPIFLEIYQSRIVDLYAQVFFDKVHDLKRAEIVANATVEGSSASIVFELTLGDKEIFRSPASGSFSTSEGQVWSVVMTVEDPELWYPVGYGDQPIYTLNALLQDEQSKEGKDGKEMDKTTKRIGIRKAEVIQHHLEDQPGTSFFFRINNVPIFCGGSNWIPADTFIPRITSQKYNEWVGLMASGSQCMIRVWGGGIYEEPAFYDACDQAGILVWQDFMFACGNYPAWPEMRLSIEQEARENIKSLRHHPCIVIWAGNNEDYPYQESEGLTYDPDNKDADSWLSTDFPARYIYEKVLADACRDLIPYTYYHFGSPWGGKSSRDPTVGDIHQWDVWHGSQERYQDFDKLSGRFVSEFGMQAFPSIKTIDSYLPQGKSDPDRYSQSSTVDFHNKAAGHERRLALYLVENFRYSPEPLEQYVYCTQLMQAECLAYAYRLWRREWKGPGREYCSGALVWQMNDCWPVTSWSICDHVLQPKLAYYAVKQEMAPITINMSRRQRKGMSNGRSSAGMSTTISEIEIWGSNLTLKPQSVSIVIKAWDVETGSEIDTKSISLPDAIVLLPNRSTEITSVLIPTNHKEKDLATRTVVAAYFYQSDRQIARHVNWPEPFKYIHLARPKQLKVMISKEHVGTIEISAKVPVKGLTLECEGGDVIFDNNLVDVVPGEIMRVIFRGTIKGEISYRYLGMEL